MAKGVRGMEEGGRRQEKRQWPVGANGMETAPESE